MKINKLCVAICMSTAVAGVAMADATADFKKWYMKGLPSMIKAMESKDASFFMKMSSPDFTMTENGRTEKRDAAMASMKQMFDMAEKVSYQYKPVKFMAKGDSATVNGVQSGKITMKPGPDKKKHVMTFAGKTVETWKKSHGKWLISAIVESDSKMTMDGKPFDPSKMGG